MGERASLLDAIVQNYNSQTEAFMCALDNVKEFFNLMTPEESSEYDRISHLQDKMGETRTRTWEEIAPLGSDTATPEERQEYVSRVAAALEQDVDTLARLAADLNRLVSTIRARTK